MENNKRTELSDLGEFGLINRLKEKVVLRNPETQTGIGDDAAVIENRNELTLVSTDILAEGIHFDLTYTPLRHLGYKAVAVNVSDIAAMNGIPKQIVVGVALSNRFSLEAIEELYEGINQACEDYKVDLAGGDTTSSRSGLVISVTVLGEAKKEEIAYRSGAQVNDLICVTGDLGGAYIGLQLLEREKQVFKQDPEMQPQLSDKEYVVRRQLKPEARMDVTYDLKELKIKPTSMIDISDGLASELLHICKASNVGARIYEDKLPVDSMTFDTAREFNLDPTTVALNGGEDYELLFTVNQSAFDKIKNHPDITIIGHITDNSDGVQLITGGGNFFPIKAQGWAHF
ncbi:MAG: thiamine-phosphate kinase [Sporocytophaga sp.]|uniref:thiamine-phosphate kinase n=1 Tax=Sporocytophaga sp. TaxID=2231183 RepID=UPI001B0BDB84|nr:thiamine-phosphate kinase [Sporocytophaga sp.]MBO9699142.1 thiamine-phosphate kinase [Sporocytophaga sp.]